jgi:hypothetical protein
MTTFYDGFSNIPKSSNLIKGDWIKWLSGEFQIDGETVTGKRFIADSMRCGFRKWQDGKPIERANAIGQPALTRAELPDRNKALWVMRDGRPEDPWKPCRWLHLMDPETGAIATFVTETWSGVQAVDTLGEQICSMRGTTGRVVRPIIELRVATMKAGKYGAASKPAFRLVKWVDGPTLEETPQLAAPASGDEAKPIEAVAPQIAADAPAGNESEDGELVDELDEIEPRPRDHRHELNDDIPF